VAKCSARAAAPRPCSARDAATAVTPQVRRTTRAALPAETRERMTRLLMEGKAAIERHFGVTLATCEEPQFLRYQPGDFFVARQGGNTPIVFDESRFRKISAVIFLSAQSQQPSPGTYGGGSFVFHGPYPDIALRLPLAPSPGTFIAFPRRAHARSHARHARQALHHRHVVSLRISNQ